MACIASKGYCSAVFAADEELRQRITAIIDHPHSHMHPCKSVAELYALMKSRGVTVAVLALAADARQPAKVDSAEFSAVLRFMEQLRRQQHCSQCLLISPITLSFQKSCEAVLAGVSTILNPAEPDFPKKLNQKFTETFNHVVSKLTATAPSEDDLLPLRHGLVGASAILKQVVMQARRAAAVSDAPVIIFGESGTGKQRIAEIIHAWDAKRSSAPFVSVNCAAITGSLAESELFGHKKGAFTGAGEERPGYFRTADKGTILLDEISELELALQPKILRVLQEGLVMPVGSDREYHIDVRVIAATNRDLKQMVADGRFRLDLFQRLNVIYLTVPSLRQRVEDIPLLFQAFVKKYANYCRYPITDVDPAVYEILAQTVGQGNVRELENTVRQILIFKENNGKIEIGDLPKSLIRDRLQQASFGASFEVSDKLIESILNGDKPLNQALDECEQIVLTRLLNRGLNRSLLARRLGVTRRTLYNKLQKHKLV